MAHDRHTGRHRPPRGLAVVAAGAIGVIAAVFASPVLMPRIIRRHPDWLRLGVFKRYADLRRRHSGHQRSVTALVTHVGRRSGTTYQTPLGAQPYGDGFVVSLPYGSQTDWCRNVMAAGRCQLTWKGQTYQLERPEIIAGSQVFPAMPLWPRILVQGGGTHDFLWLHKSEDGSGDRPEVDR
jgi:deazaflavin-dependent oxidoreductase (nitroreductase family)